MTSTFEEYQYLCRRGARKFFRPGLDPCDLEQVASVGLVKACARYDSSFKTPFEAYAWLFIVGELMHYVRDHERLVRPPRRLRKLDKQANEAQERLASELGREPSQSDLAESLNVSLSDLDALARYREQASSEPLDSYADRAVLRRPHDSWDERLAIKCALQHLNEAERKIVLGVYAAGLSQVELARRLGFSRRHISRLHRAALEKMRPVVADLAS